MTYDNALRDRYAADTTRTRIHLVHSHSGQLNRRVRPLARPQLVLPIDQQVVSPAIRRVRNRSRAKTPTLAIAAVTAPLLWVGHAILHFMHVV